MAGFFRVISAVGKLGKRAIDWCWDNKDTVLKWIADGLAIDWIVKKIEQILGL